MRKTYSSAADAWIAESADCLRESVPDFTVAQLSDLHGRLVAAFKEVVPEAKGSNYSGIPVDFFSNSKYLDALALRLPVNSLNRGYILEAYNRVAQSILDPGSSHIEILDEDDGVVRKPRTGGSAGRPPFFHSHVL